MLLLILLFICLIVVCVTAIFYFKFGKNFSFSLFGIQPNNTSDNVIDGSIGGGDFAQYYGMDAREVIADMNATYPQYTLEIVSKDNALEQTNHRDDRVRIFVNLSGKIQKMVIG